ncbi:HemK family protein methyltransferase [Ureaplasma canigenitalium]|uniref:HemK family protein methyltransferase n=1 Tax=Ureaplasma canigenitalium TaxID=42092 RepID=UPI0004E16BE4|nr:class I SAM-dependent methyltransferase [Ureaplasma canigenitalium]
MTIIELISNAITTLEKNGIDSKNAYLLFYSLHKNIKDNITFISQRNTELETDFIHLYQTKIDELLEGKALPRITKKVTFSNNNFTVYDDVFIPRVETELIIEFVEQFRKINKVNFSNAVDICAGTGVIGISLLINKLTTHLTLIDKSEKAILNIKENLISYSLEADVIKTDYKVFLTNTKFKFDLLVCNPPYIKKDDLTYLDTTLLKNEPLDALIDFKSNSGISYYQFIIEQIPNIMNDRFLIVFEIGYDQELVLTELLKSMNVNYNYYFLNDYNYLVRLLIIHSNNYENIQNYWHYQDARNASK